MKYNLKIKIYCFDEEFLNIKNLISNISHCKEFVKYNILIYFIVG